MHWRISPSLVIRYIIANLKYPEVSSKRASFNRLITFQLRNTKVSLGGLNHLFTEIMVVKPSESLSANMPNFKAFGSSAHIADSGSNCS